MAATFVAHESELAALAATVARARQGVAAAFIVGDPGSGKSRLLAEACSRVDVPNWFRLAGYEAERQVPSAGVGPLLPTLSEQGPEGERLAALLYEPAHGRESALEQEDIVRYDRSRPGELAHVDVKKLGRIIRPGHRVAGDRSTQAKGKAGWLRQKTRAYRPQTNGKAERFVRTLLERWAYA